MKLKKNVRNHLLGYYNKKINNILIKKLLKIMEIFEGFEGDIKNTF